MKLKTALTLGTVLTVASLGVSAQVEGDIEASGDGYISAGGSVLKTGLGDCLQTGSLSEDNQINACEGIEDDADSGNAQAASGTDSDGDANAEAQTAAAAAAPAAPTARIDTRDFSTQALFDTDSASLNAAGEAVMAGLLDQLSEYRGITDATVTGHTDNRGTEDYNLALSEQRAATVAALLQQRYPDVKINVQGRGESEPVASNDTAEGRQQNRRVEVEVTGTRMTFE